MTVAEQLGLIPRKARRGALMSQEDLSRRTGLHNAENSLPERGLRVPRLDACIRLAQCTGADSRGLVDGIAWHEPPGPGAPGWFTLVRLSEPTDLRPPKRGELRVAAAE